MRTNLLLFYCTDLKYSFLTLTLTPTLTLSYIFIKSWCFDSTYYIFDGIMVIIPPASTKLKGGYTGITLSVCPSVHLWTESCPLCIFNNTHQIHFIFAHPIKQFQKVGRVYLPFRNSKIWNFGEFFKFVTLTLSSFDLGSNMTQWYG